MRAHPCITVECFLRNMTFNSRSMPRGRITNGVRQKLVEVCAQRFTMSGGNGHHSRDDEIPIPQHQGADCLKQVSVIGLPAPKSCQRPSREAVPFEISD